MLIALLLTGCSHTLVLSPDSPQKRFDRANRWAKERTTKIRPRQGAPFTATGVSIGADTIRFLDLNAGVWVNLPTWEVKTIASRNHIKGAIEGIAFGFVSGLTVGTAAMALILSRRGDDAYANFVLAIASILANGLITTTGTFVGWGVGAAVGDRNIIKLQPATTSSARDTTNDSLQSAANLNPTRFASSRFIRHNP